MSIQKIIKQIKIHRNFLITSHVNPEGDALGSELAFYGLIKSLQKDAVIVNEESLSYGYGFFPEADKIIKYKSNLIGNLEFDCFAALDCSDLKRTGEVYRLISPGLPILNIDHHISNSNFGSFNWVDPAASSCAQMVYELYKKMGVKIDKTIALYLYFGILTDTGSFRFSNTSSQTHRIAAELLDYGLVAPEIYKNAYGNLPYRDMQLVARVLNDIKRSYKGKIVWFQVKSGLLKKYKPLCVDLSDSVMNFGRAIKDTEVVVLFKENLGVKNQVRINFRSQGNADVNKIANFFGGGGHKSASGCTMHGRIDDIRRKVLRKIENTLNEMGI